MKTSSPRTFSWISTKISWSLNHNPGRPYFSAPGKERSNRYPRSDLSQKIEDDDERKRLRDVLQHFVASHEMAGGYIARRDIEQLYDEEEGMFLPDRFIRGTCPKCGAEDQYGDACEKCGATYAPTDLLDAGCAICGTAPERRSSKHLFFKLGDFEAMLRDWLHPDITQHQHVQVEVANKLDEWFEIGIADWDISRDAPYFGFEIPDAQGKYFYVWLDAPIGYMASFRNLCDKTEGLDFDAYWASGSETELYHFIGKDIIYFHTLFWPAMLHGAGMRTPSAVFAHGFLTVDGQKMSKSRGTFIKARTYLDHLNPEYLRYYFAAKLGSGVDDIDLNLEDFVARVNSDLVGKVVNIASRCAGFINKRFEGRLAESCCEVKLYEEFEGSAQKIAELYEQREYGHAIREIMALADRHFKKEPAVFEVEATGMTYLLGEWLDPRRRTHSLLRIRKHRPHRLRHFERGQHPGRVGGGLWRAGRLPLLRRPQRSSDGPTAAGLLHLLHPALRSAPLQGRKEG